MKSSLINSLKIICEVFSLIKNKTGKKIYVLFLVATVNSLLPFIKLINTQNIINSIQNNDNNSILIKYIILFIMFNVIALLLQSLYSYVIGYLKEKLYLEINKDVLKKTEELSYVDYENHKTYDLLQRAEMEAGVRPINILTNLLALYSSIITMFSSMLILLTWKYWTFLGFIILPILAFKYYKQISKTEYDISFNRTKYERKSWYIAHLLTKDTFIKEVKMLDLFKHLYDNFNVLRKRFFDENIKILNYKTLFLFFYQIFDLLFMSFIVAIGILEASQGIILVGTLMTYINTTSKVDVSINSISNCMFSIYQDSLYAKNLIDFLNLKKSNTTLKETNILNNIESIEFKKVSFSYPSQNKIVLNDLSFKIKKGESIAIVGKNGSGKSTIIKLICGFYKNYSGEILLNGVELKKINSDNIKKLISVVFQDYNQYQFTIHENIGYGDINNINNMDKIIDSAKKAKVNEFIETLKDGYNQQVGNWFENGVQLSGGEWQKLALARSFMKKSDVYILDEPTAALDPISEYNFFDSFIKESKSKISIIITHRFSNAKIADKILVIDKGKLICEGNHKMLFKTNDLYREMYKLSLHNHH